MKLRFFFGASKPQQPPPEREFLKRFGSCFDFPLWTHRRAKSHLTVRSIGPRGVLILNFFPEQWIEIPSQKLPLLCIAYQDSELLAIEKPPFMHSVSQGGQKEASVCAWVGAYLQDAGIHSELSGPEFGALSRLDFETSGLLCFALKKKTYQKLKKDWGSSATQKIYHARVEHNPASENLSIHEPLIATFEKKEVQLQILEKKQLNENQVELRIRLFEGIRHQIRKQLARSGCPILGDETYGGKAAPRMYLHCSEIRLQELKLVLKSPNPFDLF